MSSNPYSGPCHARDLQRPRELRGICDELCELNRPLGIRVARRAERSTPARARISAVGVVLGLVAA